MDAIIKKNILIGVTGGIAAYKSADLIRQLIKAGAEVRVVMTPAAAEFVQPLTYQALSGHKVYTEIFDAEAESAMDHIELARWADLIVVAPASANFIAKLLDGYADNLLLTLCLASKQAVAIAPAMNQQMYLNQATQENIQRLKGRGVKVWGPAQGEQACGDVGPGRMLEPGEIMALIDENFKPGKLSGKRVLITAGPTHEAIDPVRYIGNRSTGRMGYALARAAHQAGAGVTLISGPVSLDSPTGVERIEVGSALEMRDAVIKQVSQADIFIACAAVADYRVADVAPQKLKKSGQNLQLELIPNPDIVSEVTALDSKPFTLGFAAETEELERNAAEKLKRKNLDMIAANQVGVEQTGFESNTNEILVMWPGGQQLLALDDKNAIAKQLIDLLADHYNAHD
ncbi:MAG: bifunctional phosphopantothenoylcysteine decarboxylase/phosphopantothenate--cysteine ligase CoaBC [Gammaproteobacteria bacterium]|nr:MAG: bifunctional phosphopantothenoylcysteine decarboxylase/phosphopantothenate--cysteine ligase CoaBC [Gammaproteobacteria bacterium]